MHFFIIFPLSFRAENKSGSVISEQVALDRFVFQCMSPTRSKHSQLGLEFFSLEVQSLSHTQEILDSGQKIKIGGVEDSINLLLEQALMRQRDGMMENFAQILQRLPITSGESSSRGHFGGTSPFKVQVNFDIPIFEGQIDVDALEKWLNLLEGFLSIQKNIQTGKRSPLHSLRLSPMSNIGGKLTGSRVPQRILEYMGPSPLEIFLWMR